MVTPRRVVWVVEQNGRPFLVALTKSVADRRRRYNIELGKTGLKTERYGRARTKRTGVVDR
jgi:hypothetical protein